MLFAEQDGGGANVGWIMAAVTGITTFIAALAAARERYGKMRAEEEKERIKIKKDEIETQKEEAQIKRIEAETAQHQYDHLFQRMSEVMDRLQKDNNQNRDLLNKLQDEHIKCQEENRELRSRFNILEIEVTRLRKLLEDRGTNPPSF